MTPRTYVDVHLLHSVPPSCINRDDTGSPKSAIYGGVRRSRVSSQAWKRATRKRFEDVLESQDLGVRTKRVVDLVERALVQQQPSLEKADGESLATAVVIASGLKLAKARNSERMDTEFLVLVSAQQAAALADLASETLRESDGNTAAAVKILGEKDAKKRAKEILGQGNSVDLALFGRMVANDTDLNVDASCQVAHALSVHAADAEFDYFTAVDDLKKDSEEEGARDAGAGMIGTVEFSSSTLYRYASINVEALAESLGDEAMTLRGIEAFIDSFVRSMPTGKVNTFANHTLPEAIVISVREDQPVSYVGAFERPVTAGESGGFAVTAAQVLVAWAGSVAENYGTAPVATWVAGLGEAGDIVASLGDRIPFSGLPHAVAEAAVARLGDSA